MILTLESAGEVYGCPAQNFYAVHTYSKKKGIETPWMIKTFNGYFIDTDLYDRQTNITNACHDYNTSYLIYLIEEVLGSKAEVVRYMASNSNVYKSVGSWNIFIYNDMYATPINKRVKLQPTQQSEFTKIASRRIYQAIKDGIKLGEGLE